MSPARTLAAFVTVAGLTVGSDPIRAGAQRLEQPVRPLTIVAFGDSLTSGHRLPRDQAYPSVLESMLRDANLPYRVVNRGISGETSAGGVRRLDAVLAEEPHILIVAFGANDGLRGVPVATVQANIDHIVTTARSRGVDVLLCGMEALPIYGLQYTLDFHAVMPGVAARHGVPLVPFLLQGVLGNPELMSADHIHPNAAGARVIAANVFTYLRPLAEAVVSAARAAR